jgi:DNA anti-recombination protein RmuC
MATLSKTQIDELKKSMNKDGISSEEYVAKLEEYVNELRAELIKNDTLSAENEQAKKNELVLNKKIDLQNSDIKRLEDELQTNKEKFINDMRTISSENEKNINEINRTHEAEINKIKEQNLIAINEMSHEFENKLEESLSECQATKERISELVDAQEKLKEEKRLLEARVKALCSLNGKESELGDFTDKEDFDRLEKEFEAFKNFYDKQWHKTKKKIRKNSFRWENIKKQKND